MSVKSDLEPKTESKNELKQFIFNFYTRVFSNVGPYDPRPFAARIAVWPRPRIRKTVHVGLGESENVVEYDLHSLTR